MPGPRKVRVFKDPRKSPNWYVEWRDTAGRRHCESCGPDEIDAQKRARQIKAKLRHGRRLAALESIQNTTKTPIDRSTAVIGEGADATPSRPILRLHALFKWPQMEVPVDLHLEASSELIKALVQLLPR